jgi:hypothetical protein
MTSTVIERQYGNWELLSNSRVKTWRRCPKQFEYKYVLGLKPRKLSIHLERGTWLHDLLQHHYDGESWYARHKQLTKEFYLLFEEEREDLGDLPTDVERLFRSYLYNYRIEDRSWRVIDSELDEIVTLPNGLRFRMIVDLVVEEPDGGIWIVDHKSVGRFLPPDFLLLDAQLGRYFWGMEKLGYTPLRGVLFNEIITKAPTLPKFIHKGTQLEKRKNLHCDFYTYYKMLQDNDLAIGPHVAFLRHLRRQNDQWFRRTPLAKDAPLMRRLMKELVWSAREIKAAEETDAFPRTVSKDCQWDCSFLEPCAIQLMGGDASASFKLRYTNREDRDD